MDEIMLYIVSYRHNNGWKIKRYLGTRKQVDQRIKRLKYDKIDISAYESKHTEILDTFKRKYEILK